MMNTVAPKTKTTTHWSRFFVLVILVVTNE